MTGTEAQQTDQREAAGAQQSTQPVDPWAAITKSFRSEEEPPAQTAAANNETAKPTGQGEPAASSDENNGTQTNSGGEAAKTEPTGTEEKPAAAGETGPAGEEKTTPIVEFKAEDIVMPADKGEKSIDAPEGSWLHVAKVDGLEIKEDSLEAYKEALITPLKKEIEEARALSLDKALEKYKPETAAAIKLEEMGYSQEKYYSDKRYIADHLTMEDAALVRKDLEARTSEGYTQELIDLTMEELAANPNKLKLSAEKVRLELKAAERGIETQRTHLIQQYEVRAQEAAQQRKQEETTKIKTALDTAQSFMEVPLTPEIKKAVFEKFSKGGYEQILKDPARLVELMLFSEFGPKYVSAIKNTAFENGREGTVKKLSNIPPKKETTGQMTNTSNQSENNWDAIERNFGPKVG